MTHERNEQGTVDPEMKQALREFHTALDIARSQRDGTIDYLQVPAVFGPACGGGQRFGDCTPAQLRALGGLSKRSRSN